MVWSVFGPVPVLNVPPACLVQSNWSLPYTSCSHLEGIEWESTNNAQKSPGKRGQNKLVNVWTLSSYPQMECWKSQSPQFASSDWSLQSCLRGRVIRSDKLFERMISCTWRIQARDPRPYIPKVTMSAPVNALRDPTVPLAFLTQELQRARREGDIIYRYWTVCCTASTSWGLELSAWKLVKY